MPLLLVSGDVGSSPAYGTLQPNVLMTFWKSKDVILYLNVKYNPSLEQVLVGILGAQRRELMVESADQL